MNYNNTKNTILNYKKNLQYITFLFLLTTIPTFAVPEEPASSEDPNVHCNLQTPGIGITNWKVSQKTWGLRPGLCKKAQADSILFFNTLFPSNITHVPMDAKKQEQEKQTQEFLRRLFLLLTLAPLEYTTSVNNSDRNLRQWNYPISISLAHGGRILIEVTSAIHINKDFAINTLITGVINKKPLPNTLKARSAASHGVKQSQDGSIRELKLGLSRSLTNLRLGLEKKHKGYDISFGGVGNPDIKGNIVGPGGTRFTSNGRSIPGVQHGHLYIQSTNFHRKQVLMLGLEVSAPGKKTMSGTAHNALSAFKDASLKTGVTGDQKMSKIMPAGSAPAGMGGMRIQITRQKFIKIISIANAILKLPLEKQQEIFKGILTSSTAEGQEFLKQQGFAVKESLKEEELS